MANLIMLRLAAVVTMVVYCAALPLPEPNPNPNPFPGLDSRPDVIEIIAPAQTAQETLDSLNFGDPNSELSERNKRTIGILRQLFPNLSQIIDRKVEELVRYLIPIAGRVLLSGGGLSALLGGGGGGGASGSSSSDDSKVSINLDDSDEDDSDEDESSASEAVSVVSRFRADGADATTQSARDNGAQASNLEASSDRSSDLPSTSVSPETAEPASELPLSGITVSPSTESPDSELSSTESISSSTESPATELTPETASTEPTTATSAPEPPSASLATSAVNADDENQLSEAESQNSEVRVQFTDPDGQNKVESKEESADQEGAASNGAAIDDLSLDDGDVSDENRDKRFLSFGLGDSSGSGSSGSGGGSGNFLFDIIRRPAESVARAAGQAFRILTGTDSIGLGITASHTAVRDIPLQNATKLVAGSGGTEQTDEAANAPADSGEKADGLTEGIPGPVTRLFIIANRGISNLIQDLILRLAQTSERIVNFKARLITSII